jgi:hypothetical protein
MAAWRSFQKKANLHVPAYFGSKPPVFVRLCTHSCLSGGLAALRATEPDDENNIHYSDSVRLGPIDAVSPRIVGASPAGHSFLFFIFLVGFTEIYLDLAESPGRLGPIIRALREIRGPVSEGNHGWHRFHG